MKEGNKIMDAIKKIFKKHGKIILAAIAVLVVVMCFLPAVTQTIEVFGESKTTTYSLFDVAFGKTLSEGAVGGVASGTSKITFSILNVLIIVLPVAAAVVAFVLKGKVSSIVSLACFAVAAILLFMVPSLSSVATEVTILGKTGEEVKTFAELEFSLGIGAMAIFGSFLGKERSLLGESVNVAVLDTFVAVTAGLIIFPACFTYGVDVGSGPNLIFVTLPQVFMNMAGGRIWGSMFFLFMSFAALSTIFAVFQNVLSCVQEIFNLNKIKACIICGIGIFLLSIPCVLGFNVWSSFEPLGSGTGVLDLEDYVVSNILLPVGSLVITIFCTQKFGWGFKNYMEEANQGKGLRVKKWMCFYMSYILPVIIGVIAVISIISPFIK